MAAAAETDAVLDEPAQPQPEPASSVCLIEAPCLVHGGHGASVREPFGSLLVGQHVAGSVPTQAPGREERHRAPTQVQHDEAREHADAGPRRRSGHLHGGTPHTGVRASCIIIYLVSRCRWPSRESSGCTSSRWISAEGEVGTLHSMNCFGVRSTPASHSCRRLWVASAHGWCPQPRAG
jgi:hypothetical protein